LLDQGYRVQALVRSPAKASDLAARGVTLIEGDLDNTTALENFVAACDAVVHSAGAVRGNSQSAFDRVNVAGTSALLQAISAQPRPPRLLLLSSIVAREPGLSWYAHSKHEGEQLLRQASGLDWTILRPPAVYGPGDKEMLPLFQWMHRGIALVPGSPEARTSLIHVADVVGAIIACLQSEHTTGLTLSLCDGKDNGYSWREIADIAAAFWSRKVRVLRIPHWLLNGVAALNSSTADLTNRAPMLTPPKLRELRHENWVQDNQAISKATGWTPRIGLRDGLQALKL
jgi:nucleoside-diphosphate-sugar epimerase